MKKSFFYGHKNYQHGDKQKIGILLSNLGTPEAPTKQALRKYLKQFLWDKRVIEYSRPVWWLILNLIILNFRPKKSAELYKKIWTPEGSPLLVNTKKQTELLKSRFENQLAEQNIVIDFAMRYGEPSIEGVLENFRLQNVTKVLVLPLYPQYSGSTTASTFDAVTDALKKWRWTPEFRFISTYHDDPMFIEALKTKVEEFWQEKGKGEMLLMSFHGVPRRYLENGDPYHCFCQKTARLLAESLGLEKEKDYLVSFQSLFGKEEWLRPYTEETIKDFAKKLSRLDVICPGFSSDCLETIEEIDTTYREVFFEEAKDHTKQYNYITAPNDHPKFIDLLESLVRKNLIGWI